MRASVHRGFTLIELIIVILLIGLLATFLWPDFGILMRTEQLEESVRRMKALVGMCRAQAMNESRRYRLTFKPDGRLRVTRQRDPLLAPHEYGLVDDNWAQMDWLLEDVWVESLLPLPQGPPPLQIEDDEIEFFELEETPQPIEAEYDVFFEPDGESNSLRWILRDEEGRGVQMTLDGRLGRIGVEPVERLEPDEVEKPEPLPEPEEYQVEQVMP